MVKWTKLLSPATSLSLAIMLLCLVAQANAAEVAATSAEPQASTQPTSFLQKEVFGQPLWLVGSSMLACALVVGGLAALGKSSRRKRSRPRSSVPLASFSGTNAIEAKAAANAAPAKASAPGSALKPRSTLFAKSAGHANGAHRRKVFDYNRYFADLMTSVSGHAVNLETLQTNGRHHEAAQGASAVAQVEEAGAADPGLLKSNSDLLVHQKALIEDQQKLIQEQSKVIEEKSRLIAEKSQLLKMQSELMDSKML